MKVSLIYARIGHSTQPPMGILLMASVLEKDGHEVKVEDPFGDDDFLDRTAQFKPHLIGVSFISPALLRAKRIIDSLREKMPDSIYCCGGPHATALPEETAQFFNVDFVIVGEGEYSLRDVCRRLQRNEDYHDLPGLAYKHNGKAVRTPDLSLIEDLDELPLPARHLLKFDRYLAPPGQIRGLVLGRCTTMHTRRGCPGQCIFCGCHIVHRTFNGNAVRMRSVPGVLKEIHHLKNSYGIKGIWFTDDSITNDREWMQEFCNTLRKEKIGLAWGGHARVLDIVGHGGYDMIMQMKEGGCVQLDIGVESGSPKILDLLRKGTTPGMIISAFNIAKKAGVRTLASFMIGNPTETHDDIAMTMRLAKRIKPNFTLVTYSTPTPGTDMYAMSVQNNWFDPSEYYRKEYSWRADEEPLIATDTTKKEFRKIRAEFENYFAMRNYFNFIKINPGFLSQLLSLCIKHPMDLLEGAVRSIKAKKLGVFTDSLLKTYRFKFLRKNYIKSDAAYRGRVSRS